MLDYHLFKKAFDSIASGDAAEARNILARLQDKYIETADENSALKAQIQEYEDVLYLAKNLEYDGFSYWLKTGAFKQGPFCKDCFEREGLLVRLQESSRGHACPQCGAEFLKRRAAALKNDFPPARRYDSKVIQLYK